MCAPRVVQEVRTNSENTVKFFDNVKELDTAVADMLRATNAANEGAGRAILQERLEALTALLERLKTIRVRR